jgi:hypothetical protein
VSAGQIPPPPNPLQKSIAIPAIERSFQPGIEGWEQLAEQTGVIRKVHVSTMDTQLRQAHLQVERKRFTFDLKENPQGTFLRITEEVHGRRNSIVIPAPGLEQFRDTLNEVIKFNQTPVASRTVLPLGRASAESPTPGGPADLTMGS